MPHMAIDVLAINFRHDDSQTQHRSHTASSHCVISVMTRRHHFS